MSEKILTLGIFLILLGIALIIISSITAITKNEKTNVKSAGIIFLGPIPLGFASDKRMFYTLITITIIAFVFFYILRKY